jgi:hypothetical protein
VASLRNPILDAPGQSILVETTGGGIHLLTAHMRPGRGEESFTQQVVTTSNEGFFLDAVGEVENQHLADYELIIAGIIQSFAVVPPEADASTQAAGQLEGGRYLKNGVEYRPLKPDAEHRGPPGDGRIPDIERFAFVGVEGVTYRLTSDAEAVRTRMLVGIGTPDGCTLVRGVDVDYIWRADQSGLFTLEVDSTASHPYVLTVTEDVSQPIDDHGGSTCNGTALDATAGSMVRGEITHATEFDVFTFDAMEGRQYLVELELGTLEEADLVIQKRGVYLPEHRQRSGGSEEPIRVVVDAKEAETYGINVRGSVLPWKLGNDAKGNYKLMVTQVD